MGHFDHRPTMDQIAAERRGKPIPKGPSRLEQQKAEHPITVVDERAFLGTVRKRDKLRCRKCGRKVLVQLARGDKRAEVHHLYGRRGDFRFDDRFALLVCMTDHEKLTGKVNEKWRTVGTVFIEIKGVALIDARAPVTFERVA